MKFRNYCMVVLGKTDGCVLEISKIAEGGPKVLPAKGICITTFISAFSPGELEDYFKGFGRNFFLFENNSETSGYNINNEEVRINLFGDEKEGTSLELEEMSNRIIDEINFTSNSKQVSGTSKGGRIITKKQPKKLDNEYYENLNPSEKQIIINDILDKGYDKLNDSDREILEILGKK